MVFEIDDSSDELYFPDPHLGDDDGCFAVGGDLSIDRLLLAYSNGIFPWYSFRDQDEPLWFCPMQRFVIFPSNKGMWQVQPSQRGGWRLAGR